MKSLAFTSTLSPSTIAFITEYANATSKNKNAVIEEAVALLRVAIKKRALEEGFKRMQKDKEIAELANMGLEEYSNSLKGK